MNENEFATVGIRHFKSWSLNGKRLKGKGGSWGKYNDKLVCCKYYNKMTLVGSVKGELQIWRTSSCSKALKIHKRCLDSIHISENNNIYTGGKDCKINILNSSFKVINTINLNEILYESLDNRVRSITTNKIET